MCRLFDFVYVVEYNGKKEGLPEGSPKFGIGSMRISAIKQQNLLS